MTLTTQHLVRTFEPFPLAVESGQGARLRCADGREVWDFYGGHAVALLGHCHPAVTRALREQAEKLTFYSTALELPIREQAAAELVHFAGARLESVFFCNSGAEANENALKLAIKQTARRKLAAVHGCWHGRTTLTLSVTTDARLTSPLEGLLAPCVKIPPNDSSALTLIDERCAAVIVEPIASMAGIIEMAPEFLAGLRRRCDETGTLLIFDEIQTGVGRLGRPFVHAEHGVHADIVTAAKGLANGVPIGAMLMSERVADRIEPGDLGSTFGGGPLACAALLAVLRTIADERLLAHAQRIGAALRKLQGVGPVQRVRGRGCLVGLELSGPAKPIQRALLERGALTGTSADPRVLRLMPPINLPLEAVDELAAALRSLEGV